jgi:hypothetical protein
MKGIRGTLIAMIALALLFFLPGSGFAAEKSLADILKEKGILTEEEYQQVKELEESQKAGEAKKAEEATKQAEEATKQAEEATKKAEEATKKAEELAKKTAAEKPASLPIAGYKKGFFLQTPDGKFKLVHNGVIRTLLELYQNNTSQDNQFDLDRVRLYFKGFYGDYWQAETSFECTTASDSKFLKYAYVNTSYLPYAQLRVGQFKAPFSHEYVDSLAQDVDPIKRAMITDSGGINPKYDIGVMLHSGLTSVPGAPYQGDCNCLNDLLWYGVGVFNGNGANNFDVNDDMDVVGRVRVAPFAFTEISLMKGLSLGGSFQFGRETPTQTQPAPKTPTNWAFFKDVSYRGERERYGLEGNYRLGPLELQAEWIYQRLEREKQVRVDPDTNEIVSSGGKLTNAPDYIEWGWYFLATYFAWGDRNKGFQLVGRYEFMDADDDKAADKYLKANPIGEHSKDANSVANPWGNALNLRGNSAEVVTLGFNYFISWNVRLAFNYYWMWLDNKYTIDRIHHDNGGNEMKTPNGHAMQAFYLLAQLRW